MVDPTYDCAACHQPKAPLFYDKRYKQSICSQCYIDRRRGATDAMDTEWLVSNIPYDQLTERECEMAGIASLEEYNRAKERAVPDGTEGDTKADRAAWKRKE